MKFTSALSAIALIVFAQTVAASPAPAETDNTQSSFVRIKRVKSSNGYPLEEMTVLAQINAVHVNKNATQTDGTPDTIEYYIAFSSQEYSQAWVVATSYYTEPESD